MMSMATASFGQAARGAPPPGGLATVVYRSRAVAPLAPPDLKAILQVARTRNRREAVTGVMLYDDSRFFQWLEGPTEAVKRVMHSIRRDPRHTDLEVLDDRPAAARMFGDWEMRLAVPGACAAAWGDAVLEPPREIIETLQRRPEAAPALLVKLVPPPPAAFSAASAALVGAELHGQAAATLKAVIRQTIIPGLCRAHGIAPGGAPALVDPRALELADLLASPDEVASLALIREIRGDTGDLRHLFAPLFEPAARNLGDLWNDDRCGELEVTIGMFRLQNAIRLLNIDLPYAVARAQPPRVLIAPMPGEAHQLVSAMDADWLWHAGWTPRSEFPKDDRALEGLLANDWIDVLDLSLSAALRREDAMPRLRTTIALARRASRNPALFVMVGGRRFVEEAGGGIEVGADLASDTSRNVDQVMLEGLRLAANGRPSRTRIGRR